MKKLTLLLILLGCIGQLQAQKLLVSIDYSIVYDIGFRIGAEQQMRYDNFGELEYGPTETSVITYWSLGSGGLNLRYGLYEFDDHRSIGLEFNPRLGTDVILPIGDDYLSERGLVSSNMTGFGSLRLPLLVSYNLGAGATHRSIEKSGWSIALGWQTEILPLYGKMFATGDFGYRMVETNKMYHMMSMKISSRNWADHFWGLSEANFTISFAPSRSGMPFDQPGMSNPALGAFRFLYSAAYYLNY